jgi:SOS regulatory protein LexA
VAYQLKELEKKGFLRRDPNRPRAVDVRAPSEMVDDETLRSARPTPAYVPLLGRIAAGGPILAEQAVEEFFPLPRELVGEGDVFMLEVKGDSMIDAAICNGDWVVVRQQPTPTSGDIVAAMIDGEATVKSYRQRDGPRLADAGEPGLRPDPGDDATSWAAWSRSCAESDAARWINVAGAVGDGSCRSRRDHRQRAATHRGGRRAGGSRASAVDTTAGAPPCPDPAGRAAGWHRRRAREGAPRRPAGLPPAGGRAARPGCRRRPPPRRPRPAGRTPAAAPRTADEPGRWPVRRRTQSVRRRSAGPRSTPAAVGGRFRDRMMPKTPTPTRIAPSSPTAPTM